MNNLNDLIRIWCLLLILVACNQDDNMDGIPDDATVPCVINSVSVIEPHKVNTRANTIDGDSIGVFLTDDVAANVGSTRKYSDRNNCKYTKVAGKWTPKTQCHWPKEFLQIFGQSILIMPIRKTDWIIRIGQPSL